MIFLWACTAELEVLEFTDAHNFTFSSSLESQPIAARAQTALSLDWSFLTKDLLSNPLIPQTDIAKVSLLLFANLDHEQVLDGVSNENLRQSDLSGYAEYVPQQGETKVTLDRFSLQGVSLDPEEHLAAQAGTFMLLAANESEESLMLSFFSTESEEENEEVLLTSQSTSLSYSVELESQRILYPQRASQYVLDWQSITQSGTGMPIQGGQIDSIILAGCSESLEEIEEQFLQLPEIAQEYYTLDIGYETGLDMIALSEQGFVDFSTQNRWLFALRCARCLNPAPLFVGIIEQEK